MKKTVLLWLITSFWIVTAQAQDSETADLIVGNWQPSDGRSVVTIYKGNPDNGEDPNKYYGKVVWLKEPNDENGNPRRDINNPDPERHNDPVKGMVILKELEFTGSKKEPEWENGTIYDPKNGSTYDFYVEMSRQNTNLLEARGYIGVSLFGRTDTWKRLVKKG